MDVSNIENGVIVRPDNNVCVLVLINPVQRDKCFYSEILVGVHEIKNENVVVEFRLLRQLREIAVITDSYRFVTEVIFICLIAIDLVIYFKHDGVDGSYNYLLLSSDDAFAATSAFCIPQFPLAFEFECEWPNGNSAIHTSFLVI